MNGQGESFPLHPRSGDSPQLLPEFYFREGRIPDGGEYFGQLFQRQKRVVPTRFLRVNQILIKP